LTDEHRSRPRQRTLKGGSICIANAPTIDCIVRNMTESGACLEVTSPTRIPDNFMLIIKPEILTRFCEVAWRSAQRIGVHFK
jgi:hypothetical protein